MFSKDIWKSNSHKTLVHGFDKKIKTDTDFLRKYATLFLENIKNEL